jgi:hypothetical protein
MAKYIAGSIEMDTTGESPGGASEDSGYMSAEGVNARCAKCSGVFYNWQGRGKIAAVPPTQLEGKQMEWPVIIYGVSFARCVRFVRRCWTLGSPTRRLRLKNRTYLVVKNDCQVPII